MGKSEPSRGAMSMVSSPVVVGRHSPVLSGGLLSRCGHGLLSSCGIHLLSSLGGDLWLRSSCHGASSGGSLWGGCSLYLWHLGLLTSFHGSTLVVRISSHVTSGVSSLFVAESRLSRRNVPEGTSSFGRESSPVLLGGSSAFRRGLFPCNSIGHLSSCGWGLGVPLELGRVI